MSEIETDTARRRLDRARRDVEALDRRILHLVHERLELAREIGELKMRAGVPLRNFEVEAQVLRRFDKTGRQLGMGPGLARDLALFLIEKAVETQAVDRDASYDGAALDTLVIGGKGGMGRWIASFLSVQGHRVRVHDPAPDATPWAEARDPRASAAQADLVIVAVPMTACATVLEEVAASEPRGVVAEMCSFKRHLGPTVRRLRSGGVRLVSFHPMFGPDVRMLSGRTIVICSDAPEADRSLVRGLFARTSARVVEMTVENHDRRMTAVLGLAHLSGLVLADALRLSGIDERELSEVAGATLTKQLATVREICSENPELYFEIQQLGDVPRSGAAWLRAALEQWLRTVEADDRNAFTDLMRDCSAFLEAASGDNEQPQRSTVVNPSVSRTVD